LEHENEGGLQCHTKHLAPSRAAVVIASSDFAHPHDSRPFDAGIIVG
jgi:hypothetical protein